MLVCATPAAATDVIDCLGDLVLGPAVPGFKHSVVADPLTQATMIVGYSTGVTRIDGQYGAFVICREPEGGVSLWVAIDETTGAAALENDWGADLEPTFQRDPSFGLAVADWISANGAPAPGTTWDLLYHADGVAGLGQLMGPAGAGGGDPDFGGVWGWLRKLICCLLSDVPFCAPPPADDDDGDGILNGDDNCPGVANPGQIDTDNDGKGNACDDDIDNDGKPNHVDDDTDDDGDPNGQDDDIDGDGIPNHLDSDMDGDGIPNYLDEDMDGDGLSNGLDPDIDGDGIPNTLDPDMDGDGATNADDDDMDGDGIDDAHDGDIDADGLPNWDDPDMDNDGIANENDDDMDGDGDPNDDDDDSEGDGDGGGGGGALGCRYHVCLEGLRLPVVSLSRWPSGDDAQPGEFGDSWHFGLGAEPQFPCVSSIYDAIGLTIKVAIQPPEGACTRDAVLRIRARVGAAVVAEGQLVFLLGAPPQDRATLELATAAPLPAPAVGLLQRWVVLDESMDGEIWSPFAQATPSQWWIMVDRWPHQLFGAIRYDEAVDKVAGYANGAQSYSEIAARCTIGVDSDIKYNPMRRDPSGHILSLYRLEQGQCSAHARLLTYLLSCGGIDAFTRYYWSGSDTLRRDIYNYRGWNATFQVERPAHDGNELNPHFSFHCLTRAELSGVLCDPSYGATGPLGILESGTAFSVDAQGQPHWPPAAGEALHVPSILSGPAAPPERIYDWTCPH
ncbi:hypothetical protein RAS1_18870 [Phycisphaerae bacterium RAS1]|nr:hypothetical protein RAS1_18870 [Phycisphaerae bacterium RAS1]